MAKIHILESSVYNQIAAGEVIESTASVVKELIENAIDAKATQITVRIERGGKDFIQVIDNGTGIEESDLAAAFMPHATSKIQIAKDLEKITTLGFRGEAVASIASVSAMEIRSKASGANAAFSKSCKGGEVCATEQTALNSGTEITVKNLFYNTPVRAKFLKTDRGEESEVTSCITKFMLGNPDIAFLYQIDGKNKLQSYGGGLEEVLLSIYGKSILENCIQIDAMQNNVHIWGYIGKPSFTKANRTYQTTFINGRYVVNSTIQMAVHKAYESYIMKRQYPFYLLFIDLPFDEVDVNVHPRKTDVRFSNSTAIFSTIHKVVSSILDGTADAVNFMARDMDRDIDKSLQSEQPAKNLQKDNHLQMDGNLQNTLNLQNRQNGQPIQQMQKSGHFFAGSVNRQQNREQGNAQNRERFDALDRLDKKVQALESETNFSELLTKFSNRAEQYLIFKDSGVDSIANANRQAQEPLQQIEKRQENSGQIDRQTIVESAFTKTQTQIQAVNRQEQQRIFFEHATYIGSIFQTYLLYKLENAFYIIDQHAAHERLLFNNLVKKMKTRKILSQSMLIPYIVRTNTEESYFIEENLNCLQELGFEVSQFGENAFRVESVASDLADIDLNKFFAELFSKLGQFKGIQFVDIFKEKLAMMACKAAVKGGQDLTQTEVDALFEMLKGDIGLKCPHGRPIAIRFTKTEIEKLFKRIV